MLSHPTHAVAWTRDSVWHCNIWSQADGVADDDDTAAAAVRQPRPTHSAEFRRAARVLVNVKTDLATNFGCTLKPSVRHALMIAAGDNAQWCVVVKSFKRRVWVVMLESHPELADALRVTIPFIVRPLLFVIDSTLSGADADSSAFDVCLVDTDIDFSIDVNALFIQTVTPLDASAKTKPRVRSEARVPARAGHVADDDGYEAQIDAELDAYAEPSGDQNDEQVEGSEGDIDEQLCYDESVDDHELRLALRRAANKAGGADEIDITCRGDADPAADELDLEVNAVLQATALPAAPAVAAVNDAETVGEPESDPDIRVSTAPDSPAIPAIRLELVTSWAPLCDDMITAAYDLSGLPREPRAKRLSFAIEKVDATTNTCRWIYWDDAVEKFGRYVRVDRGRVIFQPKGRRIDADGQFSNVHCFRQKLDQADMRLVIPDAGCGMVRTSERSLMAEVPTSVLAGARFFTSLEGLSDARDDADVACGYCGKNNTEADGGAWLACVWCGMQQHDVCAYEVG